jgi:hypothetical protein
MAYINGSPNVTLPNVQQVQGGYIGGYQPAALPAAAPNPFAEVLGKLGSGIEKGFETGLRKQLQRQSLQKILEMQQANPNMNPLEELGLIAEAEEGLQTPLANILQRQYESKTKASEEQRKYAFEREKQAANLANKKEVQMLKNQAKTGSKTGITDLNPEEREHFQTVFNDIAGIVNSEKVGFASSLIGATPWGEEYQKQAGELNTLVEEFRHRIRKLQQSGHLTQADSKKLEQAIPNPNDTLATMRGKLAGVAKLFQLDPSALQGGYAPQTYAKPPDPKENKGRAMIDPDTGARVVSDGTRWVRSQ